MFVKALEIVGGYTRPLFTIARRYESSDIMPGTANMFFINDEGWALTTANTGRMILESSRIEANYAAFRKEREEIMADDNFEDELKVLELKHHLTPNTIAQMKVNFFDCVDGMTGFECKMSSKYDLAVLHLQGYRSIQYQGAATFASDPTVARPGKYLCRVGYPFPEFQNYRYNVEQDDIHWSNEGHKYSSRFPADGMMSRLVASRDGIMGIELNSPTLAGLNGAPLFDETGLVYGMQIGASSKGLVQCLHVNVIREFLDKENIRYSVGSRESMRTVQPAAANPALAFASSTTGSLS